MKKLVIGLAIAGLAISASAFAKNSEIGIVDVQKVFQQVPQGKATVDEMEAKVKPQIEDLQKTQDSLKQKADDFQRDSKTMSTEEKTKQQADIQKAEQGFEAKVVELHKTEMQKEQDAAKAFQDNLQTAIDKVGKSGDYDLILLKQAAPYYKEDYDVTGKIVTEMKSVATK